MRFNGMCVVAALCLVFGQIASAQNQPCDVIVNTGERDCIYEVVGQDICPEIEMPSCPVDTICGLFHNSQEDEILPYCVDNEQPQLDGYESSNTAATAPKWSAPPPGLGGNASTISSAIACGIYYACECGEEDPVTGNHSCFKTQCGLSILWTLAKRENVGCSEF